MSNVSLTTLIPQDTDSELTLRHKLIAALAGYKPNAPVHASAQTSATGATWVALGAAAAELVTIYNVSGADIEVRRLGAGISVPVLDGCVIPFSGIADASDLSLRRIDLSNTQVNICYVRLKL